MLFFNVAPSGLNVAVSSSLSQVQDWQLSLMFGVVQPVFTDTQCDDGVTICAETQQTEQEVSPDLKAVLFLLLLLLLLIGLILSQSNILSSSFQAKLSQILSFLFFGCFRNVSDS